MIVKRLCTDFFALFFPRQCAACGTLLVEGESVLCARCIYELPLTHWEQFPNNPMEQMLWGRFPVERATALFHFHKGSKFQEMMHQLKYRGQYNIGLKLGRILGQSMLTHSFSKPDTIIPVPLHPRKKKQRGYNQSESIARGIGEVLNIPLCNQVLYRTINNPSQTGQDREERWENIRDAFGLKNPDQIKGQHILLVDDVFTTGATLEACATELLRIPGVKISLATLAAAER